MFVPAQRLSNVQPSATKAITQKARQLIAEGRDIITLSQGEPDFNTPGHIAKAAQQAINTGQTRYTEVPGTLALRNSISQFLANCDGVEISPNDISVGCGAKQVLFNALMALLSEGDEVLVPTPCWVSYPDMVQLCGGVPVILYSGAEQGFKLTPDALEAALTEKTRCIMLNTPNNPTGCVYSKEELAALADVLAGYPNVFVISDEIYRAICYTETYAPSMMAHWDSLGDRLLVINGVSKAYAMTGWRVGFGVGPSPLIKAINTIQSQSSSHTCSIAQAAAQAAYEGPQDPVRKFTGAFAKRRQIVLERLENIDGLKASVPEGSFYIFISCEALLGSHTPEGEAITSDIDFASFLIEQHDIAVVPGSAFGAPGFFRISFALDERQLKKACDRLAEGCAVLSLSLDQTVGEQA